MTNLQNAVSSVSFLVSRGMPEGLRHPRPETIACIQAMAERKKRGKKDGRRNNRPPRNESGMVEFLERQVRSGVHPNLVSIPKDCKTQGEYAELMFMLKSLQQGLTPSKPWGDSKRYDFIVDNDRRLFRVQARSVSVLRGGSFRIHSRTGSERRPFKTTEIDFLVGYVIPLDCWYVIPIKDIPPSDDGIWLFPQVFQSRSKYEKRREAWHLMKS